MSAAIIPGRLLLVSPAVGGDARTSVQAGSVDNPGISCDAAADLPAVTYFDGYTLMQGSTAHVIQDNTIYTMQSDGTWIQQDEAGRFDVYTKAETNNLLDTEIAHQAGIQLLTDNAQNTKIDGNKDALDYIIDHDIKKNVMDKVKRIGTSNANADTTYTVGGIIFTVNPDGTITVSRPSAGSSQAVYLYNDAAAILIDDYCTGDYVFSTGSTDSGFNFRLSQLDSGSFLYVTTSILIPDRASYTGINVSISVSASFSGTITLKPMICHKSLWYITQNFVPAQ